jgi:hypothetical protein
MDDRTSALLEKIESELIQRGFEKKRFWGVSDEIPHSSYFEFLVDRRLDGLDEMTPQETWEYMKSITNRLQTELSKASEEYRKKENIP